tara:strand:+ start:1741 stop:2511 length:771 start_codon:yes stop_codon:yes gene_type:complete
MATLLLKKSYLTNSLDEVPFKDLWGDHGVFTTMRLIGNPLKIIFFQNHLNNLINSTKKYKIFKKKLNLKIKKIIKINLKKNRKYNHLLRIAITKNFISISLRKRVKPNKNFKLKFLNYKRINPKYKNLKYKFLLKNMKTISLKSSDLALIHKNKIYETGTANLLFIKNSKIYSPLKNFYKGITLKFIERKFNLNYRDILIKNLNDYDEIILVGSGKGVISVNKVEGMKWRRKSLKYHKILNNYYEKAVTKCPRYYS